MSEFTDGTMTGNTLSMVDMEKRLKALTARLDALTKPKKISVATPNNYVSCEVYQAGNVVSVNVTGLNIPSGNEKLITGLPKPVGLIRQDFALHGNNVKKSVRVTLNPSGELVNWYSLFSGAITSGSELEFQFCYITEEV